MARKIVLGDVAAAAGVSVATASRALGGVGRVAEATRARVLAAAEKLDFQPDVLAQSFVTGRSFTVGILAENAPGLFSMPLVVGANEYLGQHNIASLTLDAHAGAEALTGHLKRLRARRVDGLLVLGDSPDLANVPWAVDFPAPVVYAFSVPVKGKDIIVLPDNHRAGVLAAQHLYDLGRRHVAHVTSDSRLPVVRQRARGLGETLDAHGLQLALGAPLFGTYRRRWGAQAARRILASGEPVDAIFAVNDETAIGIYGVLSAAGVRVPDDIALVGYDNWMSRTSQQEGLLTSVDPNLLRVGAVAAEHLLSAIDGHPNSGTHLIECTLSAGRSTLGPTLNGDESLRL